MWKTDNMDRLKTSSAKRVLHRYRRAKVQTRSCLDVGFADFLRTSFELNNDKLSDNYLRLHGTTSKNFGDALSKILTEKMSRKKVIYSARFPNLKNLPVYSCIGSVLQWPEANLEIWGSGFIHGDAKLIYAPRKIHAVRGKLSRKILVNQGFSCPEVYGDPAIIYFNGYKNLNPRKIYKIGLIPHYFDANRPSIISLARDERVKLIDVFDDPQKVVEQCLECEVLASSSLHGLILADSLNIPNVWMKLSDTVVKDGFKFCDYFSSISRDETSFIDDNNLSVGGILKYAHLRHKPLKIQNLLEACPFTVGQNLVENVRDI